MMRRVFQALLLSGLGLLALPLSAQTVSSDITVTRAGSGGGELYVGGAGGLADYDQASDSDVGFGVFGGYAFTEVFAGELGWLNLGEAANGTAAVEVSVLYLSLVGSLNLRSDASVFGKLGVLDWDRDTTAAGSSTSDSGNEGFFGLGGTYGVGGKSSLRFEVDFIPVDKEDIVFYSIGFVQRF